METDKRVNAIPADAGRTNPVLGFLVDCIDDSYQNELFLALAESARQVGASLLCFTGGSPGTDGGVPHPRNRIYDIIGPENVDAIILSAGTLESGLGAERLERFLHRFVGIPVVSIGIAMHGVPSVVLDNAEGMQRLVTHMIEAHGCKRIAFVRGPSTNDEAEARYRGYLGALLQAKLKPHPDLVVEGTFLPESGQKAIETLIDDRAANFDALVAANDDMALAAMRELGRRGIRTPQDVPVAGFDDDTPAQYAIPALTTVRQPLAAQALHAVKLALAQIQGTSLPGRVVLDTELVCRRSCGCPLNEEEIAVESPERPRKGAEESPLVHKRQELVREMVDVAASILTQERAEQLVDVFIAQLRGRQKASFAAVWDELLADTLQQSVDLRRLHPVVSALRRGAIPSLVDLQGMLIRAETMLHEARVLLGSQIHHQEAQRRLHQERATQALSEVAQALIVAFDMSSLVRSVAHSLPLLEIPSGFISLCTQDADGNSSDAMTELRLVLAHREGFAMPAYVAESVFHAYQIVPHSLLRLDQPRTYVVQPLFFADRALGMTVFEMGPKDGAVYEALRAQISAAVEAAMLTAEQAKAADERHRLLQRAATHANTLQRMYRRFLEARIGQSDRPSPADSPTPDTAKDTEDALRAAMEAFAELVADWSNLVDKDQDTLRAPPNDADSSGSEPTL